MTLYEFNQGMYHSLQTLEDKEFIPCISLIEKYITKHIGGKYYMLLNNELHYYTLFTWKDSNSTANDMATELVDIARELGDVKIIEENENGAIEIWISNKEMSHMYLFFNYDRGVIKV